MNDHEVYAKFMAWAKTQDLDLFCDPLTGEYNPTLMAEEFVNSAEYGGWFGDLDDETHPIWDAAFDLSEKLEAQK